jgi:hypothetical protein
MNLAIQRPPADKAASGLHKIEPINRSCIGVADTCPVIVSMNSCSCNFVELLEDLAADLANLAIVHLDLAVIA